MFVRRGEKKLPQQKEFCDFKKDLSNNMFNENLLWAYHNKLVFHLQNIFEIDKSATCYCFLDDQFYYRGTLSESIDCSEKLKMDEAKKSCWGLFPRKIKKCTYVCDYWLIFVKYN